MHVKSGEELVVWCGELHSKMTRWLSPQKTLGTRGLSKTASQWRNDGTAVGRTSAALVGLLVLVGTLADVRFPLWNMNQLEDHATSLVFLWKLAYPNVQFTLF